MREKEVQFVQGVLDDPDRSPAEIAKEVGYAASTAEHQAYGWVKDGGAKCKAIQKAQEARRIVIDEEGHEVIIDRNFLVQKSLAVIDRCFKWADKGKKLDSMGTNAAIMNIAKLTGLAEPEVNLTQNNLNLSASESSDVYQMVLAAMRRNEEKTPLSEGTQTHEVGGEG